MTSISNFQSWIIPLLLIIGICLFWFFIFILFRIYKDYNVDDNENFLTFLWAIISRKYIK